MHLGGNRFAWSVASCSPKALIQVCPPPKSCGRCGTQLPLLLLNLLPLRVRCMRCLLSACVSHAGSRAFFGDSRPAPNPPTHPPQSLGSAPEPAYSQRQRTSPGPSGGGVRGAGAPGGGTPRSPLGNITTPSGGVPGIGEPEVHDCVGKRGMIRAWLRVECGNAARALQCSDCRVRRTKQVGNTQKGTMDDGPR